MKLKLQITGKLKLKNKSKRKSHCMQVQIFTRRSMHS